MTESQLNQWYKANGFTVNNSYNSKFKTLKAVRVEMFFSKMEQIQKNPRKKTKLQEHT